MSQYLAKPQRFLVRPAPGWTDVTLGEVTAILQGPTQKYKFQPSAQIEEGIVVVQECDYRQALELVARLTTAHDVEWVIHSGRVTSRADWPGFFTKAGVGALWADPSAVDGHVTADVSHAVVGTAKEIKKVAMDTWRLRALKSNEASGVSDADASDEGPSEGSRQRIRIDSAKNRTRILVSLGGEPLYKRRYKTMLSGAIAPLPEHHASACFLWSLTKMDASLGESIASGKTLVAVPFSGTGTTGFEACCRALSVAPAVTRAHYSCEDFVFHPEATMASIRKRLHLMVKRDCAPEIVFGDINSGVLSDLESEVKAFSRAIGLELNSLLLKNDFLLDPESLFRHLPNGSITGRSVFLPLNPPYGLRLAKETGGVSIYERLGLALARLAKSMDICGYVICPDEESWGILLKKMSNVSSHLQCQTRHFTHGGHDTRLVAFKVDRFGG
jgi:23S rRNA G2445 N2-methylase RlmL